MPRTKLSDFIDEKNGTKGARAVVSELLWEAKEAGYNQTKLAEVLGMTPQNMSKKVLNLKLTVQELQQIATTIRKDIVIKG